jgi:RNA polymerase sigma factor (sigma-70 family)
MTEALVRPLPAQPSLPEDVPALVSAVAERQDQQAFAQLFAHFAPRLKAYLLRTGCDAATAEEIAQDTMVTLWRKAHLFDPQKSSLVTWLHRVARNRRIDRLRRERPTVLDRNAHVLDLCDGTDLFSEFDMQQRQEAMRAALERLPKEQFVLVRLAFFDGLSHSQISERIGLPLGTVKSRIRLGFTRLRRSLEASGVAEAC